MKRKKGKKTKLNKRNGDRRRIYLVPLLIAVPIAIFSLVILIAAFHPTADGYALPFLDFGGAFRSSNPKILGLVFSKFIMLPGLAAAVAVSVVRRKKYSMTGAAAALATVLFFLTSYLGAKLLYGVETLIGEDYWSLNGQSLFGVLYMAIPAVPLLARIFRKKTADMCDFLVTTYLILLSFIRVGCFVSGCCGGKELHFGELIVKPPVQLFEIVIDLAILSLCLWLDRGERNEKMTGSIASVLLLTYCGSRFLLEFIRTNQDFFLGLTLSQYHCILFFVIGLIWYKKLAASK